MKTSGTQATLIDVARAAGVGTTTVSRVINGGDRVSPQTLARVQAAVERLDYIPNHAARILKADRTQTIGFLVPSIADPFFANCAEIAQEVARAHDSLLVVVNSGDDAAIEMDCLKAFKSRRIDGVIVAPAVSLNAGLIAFLGTTHIPVVCLDRPLLRSHVASVVVDNIKGARLATNHLIGHGYRRILCLGGNAKLWTIQQRLKGYRQAIVSADLIGIEDLTVNSYASAEAAIKRHMNTRQPPDAVFALKNSTTMHVFEVLQKLRLKIPRRVALIGFDDFELAEALGLSLIQQPIERLGRIAAELLFQQLASREQTLNATAQQVKLMPTLIVRSSCGCGS